jgi:hypothetical protein
MRMKLALCRSGIVASTAGGTSHPATASPQGPGSRGEQVKSVITFADVGPCVAAAGHEPTHRCDPNGGTMAWRLWHDLRASVSGETILSGRCRVNGVVRRDG